MPRPPSPTPVPTIACFNCAATPLGVDFDALIAAMQAFLDRHFAPVWAKRRSWCGRAASVAAPGP
ncbi:MAG TPA: hypothetical protein VFB04_01075 [Terriglobales bacterium]|nr:hypothetical protein [Terriglobales bacterium]